MPATQISEIEIHCSEDSAVLRGDGTVYLPSFQALLVADLHLGKSASFRAGGVPVPEGIDLETLNSLNLAIKATDPLHVLILGDLIHNRDSLTDDLSQEFAQWRKRHSQTKMTLVRGNHDRYIKSFPASWQLDETDAAHIGTFELIHAVSKLDTAIPESSGMNVEPKTGENFQVGGHWHPVISVGRGADQMRLRCFVVNSDSLTIPAFGPFKGGMKQSPKRDASYYPICEGKIWLA